MNNIDKFHKYFNEIWEYRLQNLKDFSIPIHQLIIHLSICDYYFKSNKYENNFLHLIEDYNFVINRREKHNSFIDYRINKCIQILESFIIIEKLKE